VPKDEDKEEEKMTWTYGRLTEEIRDVEMEESKTSSRRDHTLSLH
jgi:hypothetical protein